MKNFIIALFFVPLFANAQKTHTVAPKETLYSLGRQYNISPKELAAYNNLSIETGLTIGQVIKIPAKGTSSPVKTIVAAPVKTPAVIELGSTPIYHKVESKETLYHISKIYKNSSVDEIKKWNHLTGDGLTEGTNLIVGYEKGKKGATVSPVVVKEKEEPKPVVVQMQKPIPVKEKMIEETEPVVATPARKSEPVKATVNTVTGKNFNGGFFKTLYNEQSQKKTMVEESGTAAVFKSTSGWEDGKYYCLHNTAASGSIVKITNKNTQKTIYAKVLDVIPDLKQNNGIMIRLSNAAADELGAGENAFESVISY